MLKNITISLVAHKLVFSGDFPKDNILIKEWNFQSSTVETNNIIDLYCTAIPSEIGWTSYDIEKTQKQIRISLIPTFFMDSIHEDLYIDDKILLDVIIKKVNEYVIIHTLDIPRPINNVKVPSDFQTLFYEISGQSDSTEFQELISQLKANNIEFYVEYERSNAVDQGASGGFFEALVFIQNTIASGVAYDLLKKIPSLIIMNVKKERIDCIKEKVAHILNTQPENLLLTALEEEQNGVVNTVFNFNRFKYNIKLNDKNEIVLFEKSE